MTDGLPDLPAEIAEAVGRYTEFRSASLAGWHPTKREMLISTRFGDTPQVHEVRAPGGARRQLTFFPDRVGGASWPRRSADYFVFDKDRGGDEFSQIFRLDVATGAITMISDGGRSQNYLGPWSHTGDRMAFGSTRRNGADRDIYVDGPEGPRHDAPRPRGEGRRLGPDRLVAGRHEAPRDRGDLRQRELRVGGRRRDRRRRPWRPRRAAPRRSPTRGPAGAPTARGSTSPPTATPSSSASPTSTSRPGSTPTLTSHIPWDVESFALSPDGKTIAFETNEEGLSVLHLLDTATGKEKPAPKLPVGLIGGLEWHNNGRDLGLVLTSARSPADVYSLDVTTGTLERWTESETGGLNAQAFSEPELVRWKSFDGKTISGFLYKPAARFTGPRPVIVNIHGGPEGQSRPGFQGRSNYYLDELGVAVLYPNVRGSTGFGKTFVKLDNGLLREDSVKDIGALLDWIPTRKDLDASRVMVTGGSYGGYMTLAVATHYDAKIRCSLDVVGISNFVTFLQNTEAYRRDLRRVEYGDERDPAMREFLLGIAPANNAQKITKPLFVVQGKNDPRVPYTESEQMVATVKKNGGPVWYLLANDEGHGFAKKKNQDFLLYATVAFVREHLLK